MPGEQVGSAYAKIGLDSKDFESGMSNAKGKFGSFASDMEGRANKLGSALGNALKVGLVAGVAAVGAALVGGTKAFMDYEQGLASVSKTTGITGDALKSLGNDLRELANSGPVSVGALEDIAASAGSLGIGVSKMAKGDIAGAQKEIMDFTKTISDMSVAFGMTDTGALATQMATIGNVYKIPTEQLGVFGSQINALENSMAASAPELLSFMEAFGGTASLFGESAEKTAAFGATLSELGVKGPEASTAVRSGLLQLLQATNVSEAKIKSYAKETGMSIEEAQKEFGSGQQNLATAARLMGVSVESLKKDIDEDLYGSYMRIGAALRKIPGDTEKGAVAQKILGAFGYSAGVKMGEGQEIYARALEYTKVKGDEMGKEAQTMANTLKGKWEQVKNNVNDIGITIGEVTEGPLKSFFESFIAAVPKIKEALTALFSGDWSKFADMIHWDQISAGAVKAFQLIAGAAGVGLAITAIARFGPALLMAGKQFAVMAATAILNFGRITATAVISALTTMIGWVSKTAASFVIMGTQAVASFLAAKVAAVSSFATMITSAVAAQVAFVGTWAALIAPVAGVVAAIAAVAAAVAALGYSLDPGKFVIFNQAATDAFNGIKDVVLDCWEAIQKGDWGGVADRLKEAFGDAISFIKGLDWLGLGKEVVEMIGDGAKAIIKTAVDIGSWIYDQLRAWVDAGNPKKLGENIVDAIAGAIKSFFKNDKSIWDALKSVWGTVQKWTSLGWEIIKGIAGGIVGKVAEYMAPAKNAFVNWIADVAQMFYTLGQNISSAIIGGLRGAASALDSFVTTMGRTIPGVASGLGLSSGSVSPSKAAKLQYSSTGQAALWDYNDNQYVYFTSEIVARNALAGDPSRYTPQGPSGVGLRSTGGKLGNPLAGLALNDMYRSSYYDSVTGLDVGDNGEISGLTPEQAFPMGGGGKSLAEAPTTKSSSVIEALNNLPGNLENSAANMADTFSENVNNQVVYTGFTDALNKAVTVNTGLNQGIEDWRKANLTVIKDEKDAAKENAAIGKDAAKVAAAIQTDSTKKAGDVTFGWMTSSADLIKMSADYFSRMTGAAAQEAKTISALAANEVYGKLTSAAQTAQALGNQVSANFTAAGNAVRIGLDAGGRQIAVIGQVAQSQFSAAGGKFVVDAGTAGMSVKTGGTAAQSSMTTGGSSAANSLISGAATAASKLAAAIPSALSWSGWGNVTGNPGSSSASQSSSSSSLHNYGNTVFGTPKHSAEFSSWGKYAEGTETTGPELAVIGESGKEFVIPTRKKRWDLLLAAMRAYGIRGMAEGGAAGAGGSSGAEAQETKAYFGILGLASMSKSVQKIINDLKDFFRISWGIIKGEAATYWRAIERVILDEVTVIRDGAWQGALDIRNSWMTASAAVLNDAKTSFAGLWASIQPGMESASQGIISSFDGIKYQAVSLMDQMRYEITDKIQGFASDWQTVISQLVTDLSNAQGQITPIIQQIAASLSKISVNVNVSGGGGSGGGGGGGGGSGDSYIDAGDCNISGNGGTAVNGGAGGFIDMTCTGPVLVNPLKYTNPSGQTSYINPMTYNRNGGVSNYQSGGGGGGYSLPAVFRAKGALVDRGPELSIVGESGPELILPAKLTRMFLSLADAGVGGGGGSPIVIEDHTTHHHYIDGKKVTDILMTTAVQKMKLRGAKAVS